MILGADLLLIRTSLRLSSTLNDPTRLRDFLTSSV
jgi:hypothetical protein